MTKIEFGAARERFLSGAPVVMSDKTRRLAEAVIAQRERERTNPEPAERWAKRLMNSMYGEGWDL